MFRKTTWKNTVSDAVSWHQDQALNTTIFILKEYGPIGFLLKEEGKSKNYKVCLGDPHTCTCSTFLKDRDPCKHICWVLMRKFRLPREHEYCFQQGLVERQIVEVLHGLHKSRTPQQPNSLASAEEKPDPDQEDGSIHQKGIQAQDVCPICQEELLEKRLPVCYCRFGCGNNVHISCMKVWADHQPPLDVEAMVKCPLCREDFGPLKLLQEQVKNSAKLHTAAEREKPDKHLGVLCNNCRVCPITRKCFKCTVCSYYHLCEECMKRNCHPQHIFAMRMKRTQKWRPVKQLVFYTFKSLETTELSENASSVPIESDPVPEHVVKSLPVVRVRRGSRLLDPGQQCRMCLRNFNLGQNVRTLPCHHKFHRDCVDVFLRRSNFCPLDGFVIFNPLLWCCKSGKSTGKLHSALTHTQTKLSDKQEQLFVPGVSLLHKAVSGRLPSLGVATSDELAGALFPILPDPVIHGLQGLRINTTSKEMIDHQRDTEEKRVLSKSLISRRSYSSDQLGCTSDQLRKDLLGVRPGTKSGLYKMRTGQRSTVSSDRLAANGGRGGSLQGLFVGLRMTEAEMTDAPLHNAASVLWRNRTVKKLRARPRLDPGDSLTSGLRMAGVLISTQHQGKSE
ncbi:E3 ubiquitin-protein ligase ZSWIM2 [Osmerus mordax]|uniref:E3 ubiquitin-protein ligase ZSWIM2 n=1 Tax=Osmerus mordax TaxID=8014 RepID=UPI00350F9000